MSLKPLQNSSITINPSKPLYRYINQIMPSKSMPVGILAICNNHKCSADRRSVAQKLLITPADKDIIQNIPCLKQNDDETGTDTPKAGARECSSETDDDVKLVKHPLSTEDLHWLHDYMALANASTDKKVYLHELFAGSQVLVPRNEEQPRDPELEKRCVRLRAQQANMQYNAMTKHIDPVRKRHPEDSIAYQVKEMDKYLIVMIQFVITVATGFAFGFIGLPLIYGEMEFGFRLLLGIISALIIAIAELYFILRRMDSDTKMEEQLKSK